MSSYSAVITFTNGNSCVIILSLSASPDDVEAPNAPKALFEEVMKKMSNPPIRHLNLKELDTQQRMFDYTIPINDLNPRGLEPYQNRLKMNSIITVYMLFI